MREREIIDVVTELFTEFLGKNEYRKTPERYAILKEIYAFDGHFDIDQMYTRMKVKKYRVSRATIYNTIELLLKCQLIRKHLFGKSQAQYEKCFSNKQHDHLICTNCDGVIEFCDPRIQEIKNFIESRLKFKISRHALNLYGICNNCEKKIS